MKDLDGKKRGATVAAFTFNCGHRTHFLAHRFSQGANYCTRPRTEADNLMALSRQSCSPRLLICHGTLAVQLLFFPPWHVLIVMKLTRLGETASRNFCSSEQLQ